MVDKKYIKRAKELGAKDAKIIEAKSIVTGEWVRMKCQFGCAGYGYRLTCPPNSPSPEQTRRMISDYKTVLLIHKVDYGDIHKIIPALEREIFLDGYYKAFGIGAGPCNLCPKCSKKECRHPSEARPSMEACGIDVYKTVRDNGFTINVLNSYTQCGNYYGVVLIE